MLAARKTKILCGSEHKVQVDVTSLKRGCITTLNINENGQDVRGSIKVSETRLYGGDNSKNQTAV